MIENYLTTNLSLIIILQALVKRSPQSQASSEIQTGQPVASSSSTVNSFGMELTSSLRRRPSSPVVLERGCEPRSLPRDKQRLAALAKQLGI